jgi:hypothetical protein
MLDCYKMCYIRCADSILNTPYKRGILLYKLSNIRSIEHLYYRAWRKILAYSPIKSQDLKYVDSMNFSPFPQLWSFCVVFKRLDFLEHKPAATWHNIYNTRESARVGGTRRYPMSKYTNATALSATITIMNRLYESNSPLYDAELVQKLENMLEVASKPRKKSAGPSKTAQANAIILATVIPVIRDSGKQWTAKDISSTFTEVPTSQKAVALMRQAIADGTIIKVHVGSQTLYQAV